MVSVPMRIEVLNYLEKSLCNDRAKVYFGESGCSSKFSQLLSCLSRPPLFTTVRLNTRFTDVESLRQQLQQQLSLQYAAKSRNCPSVIVHPLLNDCCIVENYGPATDIVPVTCEVIVDISCGAAVLRGADIYIQGILAASPGMLKGDKVSVYVDVDAKCRKGFTKQFTGVKMFVGNGVAQVSRQEVFAGVVSSGVGVHMLESLYIAPSLSDLTSNLVFPQNLPSIVCSHVLSPKPHETILDMCAAPGGKTTHIATLMNDLGRVVALDKSKNKLRKLEDNKVEWNLSCIQVFAYDATLAFDSAADCIGGPPYPAGTFDRILLDAPCSGLGQRPVIRNNASLSEIRSYQPLQRRLFETAVKLLTAAGTLVYSTCTITIEENECIVAWALETFQCLQLVEQIPHIGGRGWPGSSLTDQQMALVQRFDPSQQAMCQTTNCVATDTNCVVTDGRLCDVDTIGFFIAKFIKTGETVDSAVIA